MTLANDPVGKPIAKTGRINHLVHLIIPFLLIACLLLPSLIWIFLDRRVWPWDQAYYGEVSTDLYYTLISKAGSWYHAMITAMPSKPPLMTWIGQIFVPVGYFFGSIDISLLLFVLLSQAMTLSILWVTARIIAPRNLFSPVLAVTLAGSGPLFIGLGHQYLVEPLQSLVVMLSLFLLAQSYKIRAPQLLLLLVLCVFAGFAVKTTTVAYSGATWAAIFFIAVQRILKNPRERVLNLADSVLICAVLFFVLLVIRWYAENFSEMLDHIRDATTGASSELYGRRGALLTKLPFWIRSSNGAFFILPWVLQIFLGIGTIAVFGGAISRGLRSPSDIHFGIAVICLIQCIIPVLMLASQPPEETRYLAPILPNLCIFSAWLFRARFFRHGSLLLAAIVGTQALFVNADSLGLTSRVSESPWLLPILPSRAARIVAHDLVVATCQYSVRDQINVIGPEFPAMNANSMAYFSAKQQFSAGFRCNYTSLGYAEVNVARALARIDTLHSPYIVFPVPSLIAKDADPFNKVLQPMEVAISTADKYEKSGQVGDYEIFKLK